MANKVFKEFITKVEDINDEDRIITFVLSTESKDRDGDIIKAEGWVLDNYLKNPVVLFAHKYDELPVAKALRVWVENGQLKATAKFATEKENPLAENVYQLYKNGYMNAVSVGFVPIEYEETVSGYNYLKQELLEFSCVPVPANPEALISLAVKSLKKEEEEIIKGVITYNQAHPNGTPKASEDEEWDAAAEVREAEVEDLRVMCAWVESESADLKTAYKLPHHKASENHSVVWRGVAAAMAALFGARGGVNIPDEDRRGVYNHLSKHYQEFDKEPPEFRDYNLDDNIELYYFLEKCYNLNKDKEINEFKEETNDEKQDGKNEDIKDDKNDEEISNVEELKNFIKSEVRKRYDKG